MLDGKGKINDETYSSSDEYYDSESYHSDTFSDSDEIFDF